MHTYVCTHAATASPPGGHTELQGNKGHSVSHCCVYKLMVVHMYVATAISAWAQAGCAL